MIYKNKVESTAVRLKWTIHSFRWIKISFLFRAYFYIGSSPNQQINKLHWNGVQIFESVSPPVLCLPRSSRQVTLPVWNDILWWHMELFPRAGNDLSRFFSTPVDQ